MSQMALQKQLYAATIVHQILKLVEVLRESNLKHVPPTPSKMEKIKEKHFIACLRTEGMHSKIHTI